MYKLGQVAEAIGINARTLGDWLDRKIIELPAGGKGNHRDFDIRDADTIALTVALTRVGLPVADAARAVSVFSSERSKDRPRAQLHQTGKTLLVVDNEGAHVVCAHDRAGFGDVMSKLFTDVHSTIVLNVTETLKRLDEALEGKGTPVHARPSAQVYRHGRAMMVG